MYQPTRLRLCGKSKAQCNYFFLSGRCERAEPAAVLEDFPVLPLRKTLDAAVPAFFPVCSFLAISTSWLDFQLNPTNAFGKELMARYRQEFAEKGRWSRWVQPKRKSYKLACCDCGLVHDMEFRLMPSLNGGKHIHFRVARNNRSTALIRRHDAAKRGSK